MNKITTIQINGKAFQIEESGFDLLQGYLEASRASLAENPDKDEVMSDIEAAIADKCSTYLSAYKNVVLKAEIEKVIEEMGPISGTAGTRGKAEDKSSTESEKDGSQSQPKRLYQIREGAVISGVCNGLAVYFNIDVSIVRVIFVIIGIATHGGFVFAYILMMFLIPYADTPEQKAEAFDLPRSAQDLVNRAKLQYHKFRTEHQGHTWQDKWKTKAERRAWKRQMKQKLRQSHYGQYAYKAETMGHAHAHDNRNILMTIIKTIVDTVIALVWIAVIVAFVWFASYHGAELSMAAERIVELGKEFASWIRDLSR